jgi:translocator assembly and maintenance protein 41
LTVSDSRRALLESIVAGFDAPVRYAFAYGSGVFEQDGYARAPGDKEPMLDFILGVTHPSHFHSINMSQHPGHYALHTRFFGSSFVSNVQTIAPGVWFNAFVPMKGVVSCFSISAACGCGAQALAPFMHLGAKSDNAPRAPSSRDRHTPC